MGHPHRQRVLGTKSSAARQPARYRSRELSRQALEHGLEPLEGRRLLSVTMDEQGWTVFGRSADTRVVYVSSSAGSDANSGLSEGAPVQTIAKARTLLRNGAPDWMLLKRGDEWSENLTRWSHSGRDEDEMMVLGAYGAGARPKLNTGTIDGFNNSGTTVSHLAIVGIHFHAHTRDTASPDYDGTTAGGYGFTSHGRLDDILIEDAVFDDYVYNLSVTGYDQRITDFRLRRSIVTDAWATADKSQGMYISKVDGLLLEGNVFDHNGWNEDVSGADATVFSHSVYMSTDNTGVVLRGNLISDSASHGVQARSGGIIEDNVFLRNPINLLFGGGAPTVKSGGVEGRVTGNVFLDSRSIAGSGRGTGLDMSNIKPGADVIVANNLFTADTHRNNAAITFGLTNGVENIDQSAGINDVTIRDNIVYDWHSAWNMSESFRTGQTGYRGVNGVQVIDNDFQNTAVSRIVRHGPRADATELYWQNNRYHNEFAPTGWFELWGDILSFDQWKANVEPTAVSEPAAYTDPSRSVASYNASLGGSAAFDSFLGGLRAQDRLTLDGRYTAPALINYIREGFAEGGVVPGGIGTTYGAQTTETTRVNQPAVHPADLAAPVATLTDAPGPRTTLGSASHNFTVTYTDVSAVDLGTIGTGDVRVTGPNGYSENASRLSTTTSDSGKTVVAVYGVRAPNGFWDITDNGTYNLALVSGAARDTLGNSTAAVADFGSFTAELPVDDAPPAVSAAFATSITAGGTSPQTFTLTYTDDTGVDLGTIGTGDVVVTGPGGATQSATYASRKSSNNGKTVVAEYTLAAPGGYWDVTDNGTFSVALASGAVSDLPGQSTPAATLGTFTVTVPPDAAAPTPALSAPTLTAGGIAPYTFTVTYTDSTAVDAASVGPGDIIITDPNGKSFATYVSRQSSNSGKTVTAVYSIAAPGGFWDAGDNGTFDVALAGGAVRDLLGNTTAAAGLGTFMVNVPLDTAAPSAALSAEKVTAAGGGLHTFTIVYTDATGVDAASVGSDDLRVTGPGGYSRLADFVSRQSSADGKTVTAVYTITAPGEEWDYFDNGTYQVALTSGAVRDLSGNATAAGGVGSFGVKILDTVAPVASLSAANITAAKSTPHTFTITYQDDVGIDSASVGSGDIVVIGPDGVRHAAAFISRMTTDGGKTVTASYSVAAPGGSWDAADNGTYRVTQASAQVTDIAGNAAAVGTLGRFDVALGVGAPPPVTVTDVFVSGSGWSDSFLTFLESSGQGDEQYGFRLNSASHADELPWINLNQISVRFSADVNIAAGAFAVLGVKTPTYGGSVTYDPATFTATFTRISGAAFTADKLLVRLNAGRISDANGNALDGEWANPTEATPVLAGGADTYPSGNGMPGGDFVMRLNILPGDVNRDGRISGNDVTSVRSNQGFRPGGSGYTIFRDITGDGRIVGNDVTGVRSRQGTILPVGEPS